MQNTPRLMKEMAELQRLSPWASPASRSRGRLRAEPPCDVRTNYERDTGRILYSPEFRRLRQKTQVFFTPRNDHICTRIEHVLYVKYIASTIGQALSLNTDLIEAIALGHDIGHAPFGHSGEAALNKCLLEAEAGFGFQHEPHSLRVVDVLSRRAKGYGLNLTFEVRDGIVSHCGERYNEFELTPWRDKTEAELVPCAREHAAPATLEGCVVRFADKIAYVGRDIEDAQRVGIWSFDEIPMEVRSELGQTNAEMINSLVLDIVQNSSGHDRIRLSNERGQALQELLSQNVRQIYKQDRVNRYDLMARNVIQGLFAVLSEAVADPEKLLATRDPNYFDFARFYERHPEPEATPLRKVCDYIAGMTDHYANEVFARFYQF